MIDFQVLTPNIYNMQLWDTSGHAANYKENMFVFEAITILLDFPVVYFKFELETNSLIEFLIRYHFICYMYHTSFQMLQVIFFNADRETRIWPEANELPWALFDVRA